MQAFEGERRKMAALTVPEWLRPLLAAVPRGQVLATMDTFPDRAALAAMKDRGGRARVRIVPGDGSALALLAARAEGFDDILTPDVARRGWDADLRPTCLVPAIAPPAKLGPRSRRALRCLKADTMQPTVEALARAARVQPHTLHRRLRAQVGLSTMALVLAERLDRATYLLACGLSITEIGLTLGYTECSAFSRMMSRLTGHSPRAWRALVLDDLSTPTRVALRHQQPLGGAGRGTPSDVEPSGPEAAAQSSSPAR